MDPIGKWWSTAICVEGIRYVPVLVPKGLCYIWKIAKPGTEREKLP
jgi:hypothetical protein